MISKQNYNGLPFIITRPKGAPGLESRTGRSVSSARSKKEGLLQDYNA